MKRVQYCGVSSAEDGQAVIKVTIQKGGRHVKHEPLHLGMSPAKTWGDFSPASAKTAHAILQDTLKSVEAAHEYHLCFLADVVSELPEGEWLIEQEAVWDWYLKDAVAIPFTVYRAPRKGGVL